MLVNYGYSLYCAYWISLVSVVKVVLTALIVAVVGLEPAPGGKVLLRKHPQVPLKDAPFTNCKLQNY